MHTPFIDGTSIITVGMLWHGGVPPRWDVPEAPCVCSGIVLRQRANLPSHSLSPKQATRLKYERNCVRMFGWLNEHVSFFSDIVPRLVGRGTEVILVGKFVSTHRINGSIANPRGWIDTHARQARATDLNTLKKLAPEIVEPVTLHGGRTIAPPTAIAQRKLKVFFGWNALWTAWQLAPPSAIQDFLEDPEE